MSVMVALYGGFVGLNRYRFGPSFDCEPWAGCCCPGVPRAAMHGRAWGELRVPSTHTAPAPNLARFLPPASNPQTPGTWP